MSRRKARKAKRTKMQARSRDTGGLATRAVALAGAAVVALFTKLSPLKGYAVSALDWAWHSRSMRRVAGLAAGFGVLAALSWIMLNNLSETPRYTLDPARIELSAEPTWASGTLAARVKATIEEDLREDLATLAITSAFDGDVMETIKSEIEKNAWVRRVVRIDRRFPTGPESHSRLVPVLEVRRPVLIINTRGAYALVDGDSVVLPLAVPRDGLQEFRSQLAQPLNLVRGVRGDAPTAGQRWQSQQIAAAIDMERIMRRAQLSRTLPIEAIELIGVPEHADSRGRVHYTSGGGILLVPDPHRLPSTSILWGRPPVHANTLEPSVNAKLNELKRLLESNEPLVGRTIDLRQSGA